MHVSDWHLYPVRYLSFFRLVLCSFIDNCRLRQDKGRPGNLSAIEYGVAELEIITNTNI